MGKGKPDTAPNQAGSEQREQAEPAKAAPIRWFLTITPDPEKTTALMKALLLLRWEEKGVRVTTIQCSESLDELMDELNAVAYRIFGCSEGMEIEAAHRHG